MVASAAAIAERPWVRDATQGSDFVVFSPTRLVFGEILGNPGLEVLDVDAVSRVAHDEGLPLLIDSTFTTPYLCRPFDHGADLVFHSATKFLGGHGIAIGGLLGPGRSLVFLACRNDGFTASMYVGALEAGQSYDENMDAYRWLIEEYRVSVFAQRLRTAEKVSEKRLAEAWERTGC